MPVGSFNPRIEFIATIPLAVSRLATTTLISQGTVDDDIDGRLLIKERRLSNLVDADDIPLLTVGDDDDADDIRAILDGYERRKTL